MTWKKSKPPIWFISLSSSPVLQCTIFTGIKPIKVASIKVGKGISRIGDDKLMIIAGNKGVILRKSKYENKLCLCSWTIPLNLINSLGINLTTSGLPSIHETQ
mmetsp:Transcript_25424/g.22583  ORF Transcript_25424/g.22583 Transcript_25424/m.22583 type:complete len:103 (-) Transcript_25424:412-720(-)